MYEHLQAFATILADSASTTAIKTALIGTLGIVLAAIAPALLGRKEREPKVVRELREAEHALRMEIARDRDEWKAKAEEAERTKEAAIRGTEIRDIEINRLRTLAQAHNINPFAMPVYLPPEQHQTFRAPRPRPEQQ